MTGTEQRRERLSGEERRAQIIAAALDVFAQKGFSGTRTKEIAQAAGVSETLIFQHFHSKEALYHAALKELFVHHPVMPELEQKMAEKDDSGVLGTMALHLIRHNRADPRIMRLAVFSALEGAPFAEDIHHGDETWPPLAQFLAGYLQQRIDDGDFRMLNAKIVAQLFIETIFMYIGDQTASISNPPLDTPDEEVVTTLVTIFLDGLKT